MAGVCGVERWYVSCEWRVLKDIVCVLMCLRSGCGCVCTRYFTTFINGKYVLFQKPPIFFFEF